MSGEKKRRQRRREPCHHLRFVAGVAKCWMWASSLKVTSSSSSLDSCLPRGCCFVSDPGFATSTLATSATLTNFHPTPAWAQEDGKKGVVGALSRRLSTLQATCSIMLREEQAAAATRQRRFAPRSQARRIRRPTEMDPSLVALEFSLTQVWNQIREAQKAQQHEAQVSAQHVQLSPRRWIPISSPPGVTRSSPFHTSEQTKLAALLELLSEMWRRLCGFFLRLCGVRAIEATETSSHCFSILQFNSLARGLSSAALPTPPFVPEKPLTRPTDKSALSYYGGFTSIPHYTVALDFNWRKWRLLEVLLGGDVIDADLSRTATDPPEPLYDLLAVQEMDHYDDFFRPLLEGACQYDSFFVPKPQSPSLARYGWYSDGSALFWKRCIFERLEEPKWGAYRAGQSQVYAMLTLRHLPSDQVLVIAVTHLKAQFDKDAIRTAQVRELLQQVSQQVHHLQKSDLSVAGVLLVGDFNAQPFSNSIQEISTHLAFQSAYPLDPDTAILPYTTWKTRGDLTVQRTIDYIWYSSPPSPSSSLSPCKLECQAVLGPPQQARELPGLHYPSDHLAIAAQLKVEPNS